MANKPTKYTSRAGATSWTLRWSSLDGEDPIEGHVTVSAET
jgi:hypothetical protein